MKLLEYATYDIATQETIKIPVLVTKRKSRSFSIVALLLTAFLVLAGPFFSLLFMGAWTQPLFFVEVYAYPLVALVPLLLVEAAGERVRECP